MLLFLLHNHRDRRMSSSPTTLSLLPGHSHQWMAAVPLHDDASRRRSSRTAS